MRPIGPTDAALILTTAVTGTILPGGAAERTWRLTEPSTLLDALDVADGADNPTGLVEAKALSRL